MITLDTIVNSILLNRSYPIQFYILFLKYAVDCLRELHFDTLGITNTVELEGEYEYKLPDDFLDFVRVGYFMDCKNRRFVRALTGCDCHGNVAQDGQYFLYTNWFGMWNNVERTRIEDGKLKVYSKGKILLEYITDGSHVDNASKVTPYAQKTIEAYCIWQYKANNRSYNYREVFEAKAEFDREYSHLRSRLAGWTLERIKQSARMGANTPIKG